MAGVRLLMLSLQFATVIPTPVLADVDETEIRRSVVFFPIVGLLAGAVLWVIQNLLRQHLAPMAATLVTLGLYTLLTGALHLDGLMDSADAIGSRRPREQALDIMKDSRVGAMGVVAAVFILLGKTIFITSLAQPVPWAIPPAPFVLVPMLSRLGMVLAMTLAPPARDEGLGALFAQRIPIWILPINFGIAAVVCLLTVPWWDIWPIAAYFGLVTVGFTRWMKRKFGGMTGDTYGALNEMLEWVGWLVFLWMESN